MGQAIRAVVEGSGPMGPVQEARGDPMSFLEQKVAVFHSEREIILGMKATRGNLKVDSIPSSRRPSSVSAHPEHS